jgi:hypothetical protein
MTSTQSSPDRLDRVERILEAIASNQLEERERRLEFREDLEILYHRQQQAQIQLDALTAQVTAYIAQSAASLAAEAQNRSDFQRQMLGLQTEVRNILRELADLRQKGNGSTQP